MEWWEKGPKGLCVICNETAEKSCPGGCRQFFYCCDPTCAEKHAETHQGDYCKAHKYLKQDEAVLLRKMSATELNEIMPKIAPAQLERTRANVLFTAQKDYKGAIRGYKKSLRLFENVPSTPKTKDWLGATLGRVYANLAVCYMEVNRINDFKFPEEMRSDGNLEMPLHSADVIVTQQRIVENAGGREQVNAFLTKRRLSYKLAIQAAELAVENAPYWYKSHYRMCQVCIITAQPQKAREALQMMFRVSDLADDALYDPRREKDAAQAALRSIKIHVDDLCKALDPESKKENEEGDGLLASFFGDGLTRKTPADHPRLPFKQMGPEMLAVRMFAAIHFRRRSPLQEIDDEKEDMEIRVNDSQAKVIEILNKILTVVSGAPLELFVADGSGNRIPPITVNLIAFYLRCAVAPKLLQEMNVEKIVREATPWMSDEEAYCIATYNFKELEDKHSPQRGHAVNFCQAGQGNCMPCICRLLRSGTSDWSEGIRMAAHRGSIDALCFFLNRVLEGIDGETPVNAIVEPDAAGCNAMMHAANDTLSGYCGLSIRMLAHAASFQGGDQDQETSTISLKNARIVLNTPDSNGYTPAMAAISLHNQTALVAFVGLRAKLYSNKKEQKDMKSSMPAHKQMAEQMVQSILQDGGAPLARNNQQFANLVRRIHSNTHDHASCSYCGRPSKSKQDRLFTCSRCQRGRYCNPTCQRADYKRHKYICTAKVEKDAAWFVKNMEMKEL